jgi:CBS domain containing-hemolysin-like protein
MITWLYSLGIVLLTAALPLFSYLALAYQQLGNVTTGRVREHLDVFEAEIEPRFRVPRRQGALIFQLLANFWLAVVVLQTTRGVVYFVPGTWEAFAEFCVFLGLEVVVGMHLLPEVLLARTTGRWLRPLLPLLRLFIWLLWPLRALLDLASSLLYISEEEPETAGGRAENEGIEALVEVAEEQGMLEPEQADLIEQVVEFSDKRVREVMTPRPDIVAVSAEATLEELRKRFVETVFSRILVFSGGFDEIIGFVSARDLLQVPESEWRRRHARELVRPALFVPETKSGSDLLREMRQKSQAMTVVIDEHGSVAGVVTEEDLVEEIVGEIGAEDRRPAPDVVREHDGSLVMRGSLSVEKLEELLGVRFSQNADGAAATVAGLLNRAAGHVPSTGERIELENVQFQVIEANQRKVLRLRARRKSAAVKRSVSSTSPGSRAS